MGIFSFGKKDDAPRRRGAEAGSTTRRSSQNTRVERRSRRPDRTRDAEAMLLDPTLPEKQRARRRLVGAIALVLAAIVILPMVLDSHPKPVTDDIAIDIPSHPAPKNAARDDDEDTQAGVAPDNPAAPEAAPGASGLAAASSAAPVQNTQSTKSAQSAQAAPSKPAPAAQAQTPAAQASQATQSTQTAQAPKAAVKPAQPAAKPAQATTATASNERSDNGAPATPPGARFAVQLGAFPSDAAANRWVAKLKAAGVPAYTEQRKDADGSTRTLLRAGPFPDRAAASEAIAKVRGAGLASGSNGNAE
ncbi:DedD protein [Paraburkholderia bannensis]|uniref:DedD protein n=1 Tax=Paraburkholderia bannensis TaxID=765414 RepID=A0A7W9TXE3_9BURK|nr:MULTISPECIES: SPOR domain-containing protein [Paraburkholderia]MBB3257026.1 DedD protein [Paraburkholderia sp. WP4_3_2]MBB6101980.1 DedD protein [Paraburkholderia bannensis]